ncbi:MAG: hypothetical protein KKD68_06560, partial [Proteobacteria bacterium]|nr:hypothetical protein [Pseudomonadota bacterium]
MKKISIGSFEVGGGAPLVLIAGPCVIEDEEKTMEIARDLKRLTGKRQSKAPRSSSSLTAKLKRVQWQRNCWRCTKKSARK